MGSFSIGGMSSLSPDISGAISVNASTSGAALDLAASQFNMSQQMSEANNVNTVASAQKDMTFGSNGQIKKAAEKMFA